MDPLGGKSSWGAVREPRRVRQGGGGGRCGERGGASGAGQGGPRAKTAASRAGRASERGGRRVRGRLPRQTLYRARPGADHDSLLRQARFSPNPGVALDPRGLPPAPTFALHRPPTHGSKGPAAAWHPSALGRCVRGARRPCQRPLAPRAQVHSLGGGHGSTPGTGASPGPQGRGRTDSPVTKALTPNVGDSSPSAGTTGPRVGREGDP